jgi:hypothetical protein
MAYPGPILLKCSRTFCTKAINGIAVEFLLKLLNNKIYNIVLIVKRKGTAYGKKQKKET